MSFSKHYNWYQFQKIIKEYFQFNIKWGIENTLVISNGTKEVIITKSNNMSDIYVEEILKKIDLAMSDFEEGFKTLFET